MSLKAEEARGWSDEKLLLEYEHRQALLRELGGWLYRDIVASEMSVIEDIAAKRDDFHINQWRDLGIIPSSWTDEYGVVHVWLPHPDCYKPHRKPDNPMKPVTCLQCVVLR